MFASSSQTNVPLYWFSLLGTERLPELSPEQAEFVRDADGGMSLMDVTEKYKPTMLLGLTAVGGLFTERLVREMASHVERPVIFPLSNPTTNAECTAEQAFEWTDGRCIFASGSPFDPVELDDGRVFYPSQCNNSECRCRVLHLVSWLYVSHSYTLQSILTTVYVFPGVGLGVTLVGAKRVTDKMLYLGAKALAQYVPPDDLKAGRIFPHINNIRHVSHRIAVAVAQEAIQEGQATKVSLEEIQNLPEFVASKMYDPHYVPLIEKREVCI